MATVSRESTASGVAGDEPKQITKQEAAQNVLVALTLQIRARAEELSSGRHPLVLSERVVHLVDKTRRRYIQQQIQQQLTGTQRPSNLTVTADGTEIKRYVPSAVSKALFDELAKISFLLVLGRVKGATFAEQAKEEEEAARRAAALRRRAQDQFLGGMSAGAWSEGPNATGLGGLGAGNGQGKSLNFAAFPNLINVAFFGCNFRKLESLSRVARFTCIDTEVPPTATMPLLSVFAALRHVEFDLELGVICPVVEQLSSFCFSLRSVSITINETPGGHDKHGTAQAATAVTMNRRLFSDVWRPKGAQVKLLGSTQKKNNNTNNDPNGVASSPTSPNAKQDDHAHQGFWEALSNVKIKGDLSRRREGRTLSVIMLDDSWRGLRQVTSMSLRGLRFTSFLEVNALQSLIHLRELDLGDNNLASIAGATESLPKTNLLILRLDSNKITGGLAELNQFESLTALDISVNALHEWTELLPLAQSKTLKSLDVRANSLDARAPHERESVINAEDVVSVILRVLNHLQTLAVVNGFTITSAVRTASETAKIKKAVDAILAQEKTNNDILNKANLRKGENGGNENNNNSNNAANNNNIETNNNINSDDDDDDDDDDTRRTYTVASQSVAGGPRKKKRVIVKGVPTRIVNVGDTKTGLQSGTAGVMMMTETGNTKNKKKAGAKGPHAQNQQGAGGNELYGGINQTGLDYLRATFGEQYLMHLPQHEFPTYLDPNDPNAGKERNLSYEQIKNEIGVAAVVGDKLDTSKEDAAKAAAAAASAASLKRMPIHTPVQPVLDQFLSEIRRHEWYPQTLSATEARQKIFPVGCEMMMSQINYENACFWEIPLFPPAKQTPSQPYAAHPEAREICLVNGSDKSSKQNETHTRFFRKVLFRVVETHVGFTRHVRLEERNLSQLPASFFQQTPKKLGDMAGPQAGTIRAKTPKLAEILNPQTATGITQDQLDAIPSFSDRYPVFQCVLPSDEHTPPIQIAAKFFGVSKARGGGISLGRTNNARGGDTAGLTAANFDVDDDTVSVSQFGGDKSSSGGRPSILSSDAGAGNKSGVAKLFGGKVTEMGIDEMAELSRARVFGTGETQILAGFVVPSKMAAEFKRRLVMQLKTAAAKLSIQGVFREWPFVVRGEGSGEQRDASVPIEPTGKYLHDRIQQVSAEPESLARQRVGNDVGASDQELSLRLRRFVFEKTRKFSTEAIQEFDFVSYFNALSPDLLLWTPNQERSLIVGVSGPHLFCAENVDKLDHNTGFSDATTPEEHFAHPRRYDLVNMRAIICAFDLSTIRLIFGPAKGEAAGSPARNRDLLLVSREPRISLQFLATLVRLRFLPDSPAIVGTSIEMQKTLMNVSDPNAAPAQTQIFFRPTNIGRFTSAPFIYVAHVFFKTSDPGDSKKSSILNPNVYPMRCVHAIHGGWACARIVITAKDMRLVEVREKTTSNPEILFNRQKNKIEEPFSVDIKQASQLLRLELAPQTMFPLLFSLVFSTPSAPRKESEWILCAPHPATLFSIRRELRNVQRQLAVGEMDLENVDDFSGFPAPVERPASMTSPGGQNDDTMSNFSVSRSGPAVGGGSGSPNGGGSNASPRNNNNTGSSPKTFANLSFSELPK